MFSGVFSPIDTKNAAEAETTTLSKTNGFAQPTNVMS